MKRVSCLIVKSCPILTFDPSTGYGPATQVRWLQDSGNAANKAAASKRATTSAAADRSVVPFRWMS